MAFKCRIANQSGLKLSYWVAREGGDAHLLRPFQSSDLHVEPLAKSVIMPDSQQPVSVRTICMQFEGNWAPVTDIVVDKVGKYAYSIGSAHDTAITPVVMDVSLDIRTKASPAHLPACTRFSLDTMKVSELSLVEVLLELQMVSKEMSSCVLLLCISKGDEMFRTHGPS